MAKEKEGAAASKKKENVEFVMQTKDKIGFKVVAPDDSLDKNSESALQGIYRKA